MKPVGEYIVSILNQLAGIRHSLCVSEGLALANTLIRGNEWEEKVIEFKKNGVGKSLMSMGTRSNH